MALLAHRLLFRSAHSPGGGVGMPLQPVSAGMVAAAQVGKVEILPTIVKVDGGKGKPSLRSLSGRLTKIYHRRK
jgi:hypothetical protein